jgi:hypothetical protein
MPKKSKRLQPFCHRKSEFESWKRELRRFRRSPLSWRELLRTDGRYLLKAGDTGMKV